MLNICLVRFLNRRVMLQIQGNGFYWRTCLKTPHCCQSINNHLCSFALCYSTQPSYVHEDSFDMQLDNELVDTKGSSAINSVKDVAIHQLKKKSLYLLNFVQTCINAGFWNEAITSVLERDPFLHRDMESVSYLLRMLLKSPKTSPGSLDVVESAMSLFQKVVQSDIKPSPEVCSLLLAITHRYQTDPASVQMILYKVEQLYNLNECLQACHIERTAYDYLRSLILIYKPGFIFAHPFPHKSSHPPVLQQLYSSASSHGSLSLPNTVSLCDLMKSYNEQLRLEMNGTATIPNVLSANRPLSEHCLKQRQKLKKLHAQWSIAAADAFKALKEREKIKWKQHRYKGFGIYPFLCLLPDQDYVDIIINHLCLLPKSGEITLDTVDALGGKVYSRYVLNHFLNTNSKEHLKKLYESYVHMYFSDSNETSILREKWLMLEKENGHLFTEDRIINWQNHWKVLVGAKLLEIMVSAFTVDIGAKNHKVPSTFFKGIPAVYNSYKPWGNRIHGMTIPHPAYYDLVYSAKSNFNFESDLLPMVVPPLPWLHQHQGGFLVRPSHFVRKKYFSDLAESDSVSLNKTFSYAADALNIQGSVAWKVNKKVLDVQLEVFCANGNEKLKIAPPPLEVPAEFRCIKMQCSKQRRKLVADYYRLKKKRDEMNSLHADALYKFSIANYFRDKLIWLPHNIDFRGRSYPIPPHFNYMGDDVSRSLFMFASGKVLGKRGLEWLKIHLINLTGLKKYENLKTRLAYADQMIDDIVDSAKQPLDGRGWWKNSEEPWQTLAACIELTEALELDTPENFVSHLPIYQDGSCNGLQHYAALGRDVIGALQVNLQPSEVPRDVYTGVADVVEELRKKDADSGIKIAEDLKGYVSRKVVKQTVMTTVYGVTRYGGAQQIKRQLINLENFPSDKRIAASVYLVNAIFKSISSIFTSATCIQIWLTDIAKCMAKGGKSVEWMNLLGLLSVQPYFKYRLHRVDSNLQGLHIVNPNKTPNVMKQCNAFPPNFIHSLDSTHMMLTALHCYHAGLKFSAVHDCFWTHASAVDQMNVICREQFIELHKQPILEELASHLRQFLPEYSREPGGVIAPAQQQKLRELLSNIPKKGNFDLNLVKNSTFFFS